MKGLLRNNYYSMQDGMKLSLLIILLTGAAALVFGSQVLTMAISLSIFMFPMNIGASLQTDETSKWNKFEIVLPVKRSTIVICKYVGYLGLLAIGVIVSLVIVLLCALVGHEITLSSILFSYSYGLAVGLFTGAFLYPLLLLFGALRSEMIIVISAILAVGLIILLQLGVASVLQQFLPQITLNWQTFRWVGSLGAALISCVCFAVSCTISIAIHRKKEF